MLELKKHEIRQNRKKAGAFTQITLDDDYIVPDSKADVVKIIHTMGNVTFEEPKVTGQSVWVKGRMDFTVLYRSDQAEHKVAALQGAVPFQEKISMDSVDEEDLVNLSWDMEDLSVNLINSRKLDVRALLDIRVEAEEKTGEEIPESAECSGEYQQKNTECTLMNLVIDKKDILRVRNEITLPNAKPNIYKILWQSIQPQNIEKELKNGEIRIRGEAQVGILYRAEEDEQVQWFETTMPFQGNIECEDAASGDIFWVWLEPASMEIESRSDYDGEERLLGIEMVFGADVRIWREETIRVLQDIFAVDKNVFPQTQDAIYQELVVKNHAKIRMGDQMHLEGEKEKILQICSCRGDIHIDEASQTPEGIFVSGVLTVHLLYVTADDNEPVEHIREQLPFEQLVEVPGMSENVQFYMGHGIDQINVNLLDNSTYEVKAAVSLEVLAIKEHHYHKITDLREEPFDPEELKRQPGIMGYVVKEGEELWDIAKQYHTTVGELMQTNSLKEEKPEAGSRILIVKKVG